jgi:hydrogenase expression/formation protein HypC
MCLGIPMKIVAIKGGEGLLESGGLRRKASLSLIKSPRLGDYVLVHAGFAIEKVKDKEAKNTLKVLREL